MISLNFLKAVNFYRLSFSWCMIFCEAMYPNQLCLTLSVVSIPMSQW